jgi:hypothetical protein
MSAAKPRLTGKAEAVVSANRMREVLMFHLAPQERAEGE